MTTTCCLVYITAANKNEAEKITTMLLEEHLVACVNIVENVPSLYWWQGGIVSDKEVLLFAKTAAHLLEVLIQRVKEIHSYQTPCITALPIIGGNAEYLDWICSSVQQPDGSLS